MIRTGFLYIGAAGVSIKPRFLSSLPRSAAARMQHHRDVPSGSPERVREALVAYQDDGMERIMMVCDLRKDETNAGFLLPLRAVQGEHGRNLLNKIRGVEFFINCNGERSLEDAIAYSLPLLQAMDQRSPGLSVFATTNAGSATAAEMELSGMLKAFSIAEPSRMAEVGEGLDATRSSTGGTFFLSSYTEMDLPGIDVKTAFDRALFEETFRPSRMRGKEIGPDHIQQIFKEHGVGEREPVPSATYRTDSRRAKYRDNLLHMLVCDLITQSPQESAFTRVLEALSKEVCVRSVVLADLLVRLRLEIAATRNSLYGGMDAAQESELTPELMGVLQEGAVSLSSRFSFALWPLLPEEVRPQSVQCKDMKELFSEYAKCLRAAENQVREDWVQRAHLQMRTVSGAIAKQAVRIAGAWRPAKSLLFVPPGMKEIDRRYELWPDVQQAAVIGLAQREPKP